MAINILQELNLGSAKPSFSRDEVASLADIKNLDVATKYPNNYEIYCREDGCKYRLNKVAHSTMQDNLPHPTGKWRRSDAVISSAMPAPITIGDVILYLGPTVMDPLNQTKVKYQTGKYYRTEWGKTSKQMYAFIQTVESNAPIMVIDDGSGNQSAGSSTETKVWYSDTLNITTDAVLFTPDGEGALFENREHAIIVKSTWDGESAITDYVYGDGSADAKPELTRDSTQDAFFDSYPALVWKLFDTEAEVKEAATNAENALEKAVRIDSLSDEIISEIAGAGEEVKEFIYGGNADGFVEVYNREAQFMYEMDLEKQKSCTDIASYFYNSDDFTSTEYTTDDGLPYTVYFFSGPAYYFVPFPTDAIDLYLASAAEENKISYENKIADASQSEEALEVLNNSFVTSAVNDNKCLLVSNTILLNKENEEESRTVSAEELDSVLANDVEVTLGTYDCDTFTYDIDEAYVGIAIYTDALKMIHDFMPEREQDPEFETMTGMYRLMYDLNDVSMTYLRIGVRNVENLDANHIRFTLGDEEYFGGLKDHILSRALEEIQNMFTSIGITYTEEAALEYLGVRLSVLTYIHIHRDNEAILDVNSLYDSNLSNSLAEHIQVLSGGKNFIDSTNESFQSLKNRIKSSKSAIDKSISEIKSDMSDMDTKIDGVIETIEEVNETLSPDIMAILNKTSDSFSEIDFDTNSKLKNLANINNKLDLSVIAPNWYENGYNAFVNLGEGYVLGRSRIYPEYINYFTDDSDYGEKDSISNVFIDAVDYSMAHQYIQKYIGLCLYSDFINNDYVNTIIENGQTPSRYDFIRSLIMNKPHIDFNKFTDNYRKQMIRSDNGEALATINSVVDVYVAAIAGEPGDINSYVWKKYTSADTIIEVFTSALDTMNTSVLSKMNQIKLGIILAIDCTLKTNNYSVFANYDKVDTKEFFAKNISISDNRINKAIESYNRSESIKDTPEVMYLPSTISCMVSATNTDQGKTFDFAAIIQPNISAPMEDNGDGTYTLPQVSDTYNTYGYTKINDVITSGTMWYTAGFFGEELSPGLSVRSFSSDLIGTTPILSHRTKLAWYDAEYMKGINTSLKSKYPTKEHDPRVYNENLNEKTNVDVSELFLNIDTRIVKEIYIRVISEGNNMGYPNLASYINTYGDSTVNGVPYLSIGVQDIPGFKKIPINTRNDIYTISMQRVIDICGRPLFANNISEINKGAYILFCIKIDTTQIPTLYALGEAEAFDWYRVGTLYGYNSLTESDYDPYYNKRMVLYNSLFNDIEHSPKYCSGLWHAVYISGSVDQSLRETKNIVYDEVNSKTSKIAKYCSSDNDLNYLETGGIGYRARKDTEDNSKYLADVYMKTEDGSVIKIAEGSEITTRSAELIKILSNT